MKDAIQSILRIPRTEITDVRIDRLLKMLSHIQAETLDANDFTRLLNESQYFKYGPPQDIRYGSPVDFKYRPPKDFQYGPPQVSGYPP